VLNKRTKLVVSMPIYNEAKKIEKWLFDIRSALFEFDTHFIVVNDASKDNSRNILEDLKLEFENLSVINNDRNLGHGRSTLLGIKQAMVLEPDLLMTVDGDGGILTTRLKAFVKKALKSEFDVVEGVRVNRVDPIYRKVISILVRILVFLKCKKMPKDGNTPIRIYRAEIASEVISSVPEELKIPNMCISAWTRKRNLRVIENEIECDNMGELVNKGSTWSNSRRNIPNLRFIKFCFGALIEWFRFKL
jgi:dolichol-phosphate mannosyltransferase